MRTIDYYMRDISRDYTYHNEPVNYRTMIQYFNENNKSQQANNITRFSFASFLFFSYGCFGYLSRQELNHSNREHSQDAKNVDSLASKSFFRSLEAK